MAFLETGIFCAAEEYARGLSHRVNETQLQTNDLYTMLLRLDSEEKAAAKLAVRPLEIASKMGFAVVRFTFLDPNLNPTYETKETVANGLIAKVQGVVVTNAYTGEKFAVNQAYFKDYFDDQFGNTLAESDALSLVG
jgi:hypothetical protein